MSRLSGYRLLGRVWMYYTLLGGDSLGYRGSPRGSRFQWGDVFFPKTTKKPPSPKNNGRARRPPSRLKYHIMTMGEWVVLWPTTREGGAEPH